MLENQNKQDLTVLELTEADHPILAHSGSENVLSSMSLLARALMGTSVDGPDTFQAFLQQYHRDVLLPIELPILYQAYCHAAHSRVRELIDLDLSLAEEPLFQVFARNSERIGKWRLKQLESLKEQRCIQRYLKAVDRKDAFGWHLIVHGISLAVYSKPICQGLVHYAHFSVQALMHSAADAFPTDTVIDPGDLDRFSEQSLAAVKSIIASTEESSISIC